MYDAESMWTDNWCKIEATNIYDFISGCYGNHVGITHKSVLGPKSPNL